MGNERAVRLSAASGHCIDITFVSETEACTLLQEKIGAETVATISMLYY